MAGNVASDMAIASLEYAMSVLDTRLIVVLGHEQCGAVAASVKNEALSGKMNYLVEKIKPALAKVEPTNNNFYHAAVIANIQYQAEILQQKSKILSQLIDKSQIKIVRHVYDIDTGKVTTIA
ncbi:hypothetical protein NSMS1_37140 [Nostoc sp. MS1]|nr:hypothetical protein NSMS1_37140 [Nostoc sp. MS1]